MNLKPEEALYWELCMWDMFQLHTILPFNFNTFFMRDSNSGEEQPQSETKSPWLTYSIYHGLVALQNNPLTKTITRQLAQYYNYSIDTI